MVAQILCVAEKPSIAKAVAQHLAGGNVPSVGETDLSERVWKILTLKSDERSRISVAQKLRV